MPTTKELLDAATVNMADIRGLAAQIIGLIVASDALHAADQQKIADLLAGDTETAAAAQAIFDASEVTENELRAAVPGVPPVGGTPLLPSYDTAALFTTDATAYTGPEVVRLDGIGQTTAFTGTNAGTLDYYTHSAGTPPGVINTTPPTD